jgi:hypothetical protein
MRRRFLNLEKAHSFKQPSRLARSCTRIQSRFPRLHPLSALLYLFLTLVCFCVPPRPPLHSVEANRTGERLSSLSFRVIVAPARHPLFVVGLVGCSVYHPLLKVFSSPDLTFSPSPLFSPPLISDGITYLSPLPWWCSSSPKLPLREPPALSVPGWPNDGVPSQRRELTGPEPVLSASSN